MSILIGALFALMFLLSILSMFSFARPRKKPTDRLESWMTTYQEPDGQEEKVVRKGLISAMGGQAERLGIGKRLTERTRRKLIQADIPLSGYEFNIIRFLIGIIVGLLPCVVTGNILILLFAIVGVWIVANLYVMNLKAQRLKLFSNQLGDALTLFANSLRAGFSFLQAISSVAREMPDPISKEFTKLLKEMSLGLSMDKALSNMLLRVPLDDLELLIIAIMIQKEVGGNLAEIIDTIASTIRERITIQREIKTLTAQGKLSGFVVGFLPIFLGVAIFAMSPSYISILFTEPIGQIMIGMGILNMIIGLFVIIKIVNIEV